MNEETKRPRKTILKRVGLVALGVLVVMVLAGLTSPVIMKSRKDPLFAEIHGLRTVGTYLHNHAATHDGAFPGSLNDLVSAGANLIASSPREFRDPKNGKREPWIYHPGFILSDRGDTILAASPVTVARGDRDDLRMVLSLKGAVHFLTEADYQSCMAEQSSEDWKRSGRDDPRSPWDFLSLPAWQHWAEEPALVPLPSHDEIAGLIRSLKAGDRTTRWNAADQLAELSPMPPEVVRALFDALGDGETAYHAATGLAVQSLRDEAIVTGMVEKLRTGKGTEAYWAAVSLEDMGLDRAKEAIPLMIEALVQSGGDIPVTAAKALAGAGPGAVQAVPQLVKVAASGDSWEAKCSVIALGRIGPPARDAVPVLAGMLGSGAHYPIDVARALWRIDQSQGQRILPVLMQKLEAQRSSQGEARDMDRAFFSAVELLGEMGEVARPAVPILRANLAGGAKVEAAWALARIDPDLSPEMIGIMARSLHPPRHEDRLGRLTMSSKFLLINNPQSVVSANQGVSVCGVLWQLEPAKRDELVPVLVTLLREWKAERVLNGLEAESRTAIPALEFLVENPPASGVGHLAREALQVIRTNDYGRW